MLREYHADGRAALGSAHLDGIHRPALSVPLTASGRPGLPGPFGRTAAALRRWISARRDAWRGSSGDPGVGTNLARSIRDTPRHPSARRREYNVKEETRTTEPPTRVKD
jgi:hypothetical protein